jgi:hypothetical protein
MLKRLLRSFNTFIGHLNIDYPIKKQRSCYSDAVFSVGTALLLLLGYLTSYSVKIKVPFWLFEVLLGE